MNQSSYGYHLHIGTASIMLVILTLCLTCFSVLCAVGARADDKRSRVLQLRMDSYYRAVNEGEAFLEKTNHDLEVCRQEGTDRASYFKAVQRKFGARRITRKIPISEVQYLYIVLEALDPEPASSAEQEKLFSVLTYKVVTDDSHVRYEKGLHLLRPDENK